MEQSVPKRRNIKFRRRWIIQKKEYTFQDDPAGGWGGQLLHDGLLT